jgi:hypothetical protein
MAALEDIRQAITDTLDTIPGLRVTATVPDVANLPAVVILPRTTNFDMAFGRGFDEYEFDLAVLVSRAEPRTGQDALDAFITGAGSSSIRQTVFNNRTLGLSDGTQAHVSRMSDYGTQFPAAGVDHIGAVLRLVVQTIGTA